MALFGKKNADIQEGIVQEIPSCANCRTAEEMYNFCKDNNLGKGFTNKYALKHFGLIADELKPSETVELVFIGLHNFESATKHDNNFAYCVTNERLIYAQKKVTGEMKKAVSLKNINDIGMQKTLLMSIFTIDMRGEKIKIGVEREIAQSIFNRFRDAFEKHTAPSTPTAPQLAALSVADELKKFKDLLDAGIITQQEFDDAKAKLLS